ncbi:MAG: UDP-N-acetylglucosamine 2-epimerase (non-hydrolyzing) [Candidatus Aenigmarchaeota archaeon]|nr:UDP-N-acetylglucosamine 2-epimerase (non-hydrolyzing) [Candidatus Aenigmarchaeota archaeon]
MKIVSVVGARPQFIKCALLSREIRKFHKEVLIHTGQHYDYDMSRLFFEELSIPEPDYNLGIGSGSHGAQTGNMLVEIERVLTKEKPDMVLVYGDTNSTLAGALAGAKLHIPVAHVESGLRSFDKSMPEEVNRILTDHVSDLLFAPTKTAVDNLKKEGIKKGVHLTGDIMMDALLANLKIAEKSNILKNLEVEPKKYLLATVHRASNTDDVVKLKNIIQALSESGDKIIFPVHPRTEKIIRNDKLKSLAKGNLILTKPIGYIDFLWLQNNAKKILTDSGGIQKEAYMLGVPCITLRDNTEWVETVKSGWNVLSGTDKKKILDNIRNFRPHVKRERLFGDGKASKRIVQIINDFSV